MRFILRDPLIQVSTVADALLTLAVSGKSEEIFGEAEANLKRALAMLENALGSEHERVANCRYELADAILRQGRTAEAEHHFRESLAVRERVLGEGHPAVAESLGGFAELRQRQGAAAAAEALYRRALAIWEQHPKHSVARGIPAAYAAFLRAAGRDRQAEELQGWHVLRGGRDPDPAPRSVLVNLGAPFSG